MENIKLTDEQRKIINKYNHYLMAVVGNRSHRQFKMGDEIDVIVSAASKIKRTIDLEIILDSQNHSQNVRKHRRFR
jgi:exoribonuclease R